MNIFSAIENYISSTVWPFLKNVGKKVVHDEIAALKPIMTKLVEEAGPAVVQAAASGSIGQLGSVLGDLVKTAAVAAENAAVSAGATSLFAALGTALASNPTTATSLAPAPPPALVGTDGAAPAPQG